MRRGKPPGNSLDGTSVLLKQVSSSLIVLGVNAVEPQNKGHIVNPSLVVKLSLLEISMPWTH